MATACDVDLGRVQETFVRMMPEIERRADLTFRHLDPEAREEAAAETLALCWRNLLQCATTGRTVPASSLAHYAMLQVGSGRGFCGQDSTDVLSPRTQLLGRATVRSLNATHPAGMTTAGGDGGSWWDGSEALEDRRVWERPFECVRIRHDYGAFLSSPALTGQEKRAFDLLAQSYRTSEVADALEVSPPRVCQIKHALAGKLTDFMGEDVDPNYRALCCRASASG